MTTTDRKPAMTSTAHPAASRVQALDLLRLFAALAVVSYHYTVRGGADDHLTWLTLPEIGGVTQYGFLGVQLFFVISGFVIAFSAEGRTTREFFVARAARIYPGFIVCMTLTFAVLALFGAPEFHATIGQWLANFAIVAPAAKQPFMDGAYWSIVYEIIFYVWIAALIASGAFPRYLAAFVAAWLALSLGNELLLGSNALRRLFLTDESGFFAAGVMLYMIYSGRRSALTFALLIAATALGAFQADWSADWNRQHFAVALPHLTLMLCGIGAVAVVAACLTIRRLPLPATLLLAIGGLTYPLYLIHQMVGFTIFNRLHDVAPRGVLVLGTLVLMVATAWLIYRFVEHPGQKVAKRALSRILRVPARRPVATAPAPAFAIPVFGPASLPRAPRPAA